MNIALDNMINQQIMPVDVFDQNVLNAMSNTPREVFFDDFLRDIIYADTQLPLDDEVEGEENSQDLSFTPSMVGKILQALEIGSTDHGLEIGCGSGYLGACMAKIAKSVDSVDIVGKYIERAKRVCATLDITTIKHHMVDIRNFTNKTYDVISVNGAVEYNINLFQSLLSPGGRMFILYGNSQLPTIPAYLYTNTASTKNPSLVDNLMHQHYLFSSKCSYLKGFKKVDMFDFGEL